MDKPEPQGELANENEGRLVGPWKELTEFQAQEITYLRDYLTAILDNVMGHGDRPPALFRVEELAREALDSTRRPRTPSPASTDSTRTSEGVLREALVGELVSIMTTVSLCNNQYTSVKRLNALGKRGLELLAALSSEGDKREAQKPCVPNIDTQRLDWLNRRDVRISLWNFDNQFEVLDGSKVAGLGKTVREAIDEAMGVPSPEPTT